MRGRHQARSESNLGRRSGNLTLPKRDPMANLGVFGATVADEIQGGFGSGRGGGAARMRSAAPAPGAPVATGAVRAEGAVEEEAKESNALADAEGGIGGGALPDALVQPAVRTQFAVSPSMVTASRGYRAWAPKALPVRRWQARQWQTEIRTGSPRATRES